ncbi:MAG: hypothetical protein AAF206_07320 [Bacteroidota bacterium]
MKQYRYPVFLLLSLLSLVACQNRIEEPPENPFDKIVYPEPPMPLPEPDPASLVGLHKNIFSVSCAVPGCHDGSFEPDFRTVQSTYSTLVFHPVIKNDPNGSYEMRVVPNSTAASWLYNRVTTEDQTLGRMPLYDNPLDEAQLQAISDWINAGAPDMFGNPSTQPDRLPVFAGVAAFIDFNGFSYRVDSIRGGEAFNPFGTLNNREMTLWFGLTDDNTDLENLQDVSLSFSEHFDDLSNAITANASYDNQGIVIPDYFGPGSAAQFHWFVKINTAIVPKGMFNNVSLTFMRLYAKDGENEEAMEFPRDTHPLEFKTYMSFVTQ